MPLILNAQSLSKSYDGHTLFEGVSIRFHDDERVGMIGPNGAGKSTLMKILAGLERADGGVVETARNARVGYLAQEEAFPGGMTVEDVLLDALKDAHLDDHAARARVRIQLGKLGFADGAQQADVLSGGWRKRLAIGRELVREPDLLLLDEPTNHLDVAGIRWLEQFLQNAPFAFVMISHDRYFLENVTTRVVELNACYEDGYFSVNGRYSDFLEKREEWMAAQQKREQTLAINVRREIDWLRRGPQGRGTKANARIRDANRQIRDLAEIRQRMGREESVDFDFNATGRRTQDLIAATGLAKSLGGKTLFRGLEFTLGPGECVGIVGNNGTGKTTLLRILAGQAEPDAGQLKRAHQLQVRVFDQNREQLDRARTLRRTLAPYADMIDVCGRRVHVTGWAQQFLFRTAQLENPVGDLSGGEQARVMIALMMQQPGDVLMLDEPTNDLDIPSIDVLEQRLLEFPGGVALITHDRHMLDNLCHRLVGLHDNGECRVYGSYAQWQAREDELQRAAKRPTEAPEPPSREKRQAAKRTGQALSWQEQKELARVERLIPEAEAEVERLNGQLSDPTLASDRAGMTALCERIHEAQTRVDALYARWEALEEKRQG